MKQSRHFLSSVLLVAAVLAGAFSSYGQDTNGPVLSVKVGRETALYVCDEPAEFVITRAGSDQPTAAQDEIVIKLRFSSDDGKLIEEQEKTLRDHLQVFRSLKEPGFLRCDISWPRPGKKPGKASGVAGFEPERIQAETRMPADFDLFWSNSIARLAAMPLDFQTEEIPAYSDTTVRCHKVSALTIDGSRIYAYLGVPANKEPPFPLIVLIPGAGLGPPSPEWVKDWAAKGALALNFSIHEFDIGIPRSEVEVTYARYKDPQTYKGVTNREDYLFYRSILGLDRTIKHTMSRPDFDGKHAVVTGSSQGGGLTLMMAGLNPQITACAANVPALCDHGAYRIGRTPGWPSFVPSNHSQRDAFLTCSRYYDVVNFAGKIRCPAIVSVGLVDGTCVPSSVYSAYNEIQSPKRIFIGPLQGHESIRAFANFSETWLPEQLGLDKPVTIE